MSLYFQFLFQLVFLQLGLLDLFVHRLYFWGMNDVLAESALHDHIINLIKARAGLHAALEVRHVELVRQRLSAVARYHPFLVVWSVTHDNADSTVWERTYLQLGSAIVVPALLAQVHEVEYHVCSARVH